MKYVFRRFTSPRQTSVDPCPGTYATVQKCMLLLSHRHSFLHELDSVCLKHSLLGVLNVVTRQILNEESDIFGEADVQALAKVFVSASESISVRRKKHS